MNSTLNTRPCRVRADAEFTAVPLRSAIRPRLPSTTGCGNPLRPGSPGNAHWLPDSMPAPAMTVKPRDLWPPARPARRRPGSASRWPRHPPHRTHSRSPPRRRAPPPGRTPQPRQTARPSADPRHCARRSGPGRGRHDRPMITNTDHKSRAQKSPSLPPGVSGTKYLSSSRTAATSAAAASLITARPGSSGLPGRTLRLSRDALSGPRTSSDSSRPTTPASITTPTTCTFRPWEEPRRGRAGGAAQRYRPGSDGCTAGRDVGGVLGAVALSAG
jgi:hypothetical protein